MSTTLKHLSARREELARELYATEAMIAELSQLMFEAKSYKDRLDVVTKIKEELQQDNHELDCGHCPCFDVGNHCCYCAKWPKDTGAM